MCTTSDNDPSDTCSKSHDAAAQPRVGKNEFEIQARSCTLAVNLASPADVLWRPATCYRIPIFQRPYSWGEAEVRRLVTDLLTAFLGRNGRSRLEPMFIGTMQLMMGEPSDREGFTTSHDIIDGQQRITTMILLLRALETLAPEASIWKSLNYSRRLTTKVSGEIQQTYLEEAMQPDFEETDAPSDLNAYRRNFEIIEELLKEDEGFDGETANVQQFAEYLSSGVYFVIIETRAQLSKTLQIFDAINTSGMDLNGGDIFKIRYYEFLRERKRASEAIFDEVCALYERIDQGNVRWKRVVVSMEEVLSLAQQILITDYGLSVETRNLAGTTFFERLFDVILNIQPWENFQKEKCDLVELPLRLLEELIDVCFEWEDILPKLGAEAQAMSHFIWWSRYGRFHYLIRYYLHSFHSRSANPEEYLAELEAFIVELCKLHLIYSIHYRKEVKEGRQQMRDLMALLPRKNFSAEPCDIIAHLVRERTANFNQTHDCLLNEPFAEIPKAKNIVCRLDAMLAEMEAGAEGGALKSRLFDVRIDIEHIQSFNHKDAEERAKVHAEWGDELNQLGNLIVLEYDLNRSIGNGDYARDKRDRYEAESEFGVVQAFAHDNATWDQNSAKKRRETLAKKLATYLCGPAESQVSP